MKERATDEQRAACQAVGCEPAAWHEDCPLHGTSNNLPVYVLYNDTTHDYPGEWVARLHVASAKGALVNPELTARGRSREECVANLVQAVPRVASMVFMGRSPNDDPVIAGIFL